MLLEAGRENVRVWYFFLLEFNVTMSSGRYNVRLRFSGAEDVLVVVCVLEVKGPGTTIDYVFCLRLDY